MITKLIRRLKSTSPSPVEPVKGGAYTLESQCKEHKDIECKICPKYVLTFTTWDDVSNTLEFWVGQDAGFEYGPMGMSDCVSIRYIPGTKPR